MAFGSSACNLLYDRVEIRWPAVRATKGAARSADDAGPEADVVDEYGGHYGRDGFYYDRFGGHYDQYGYEYKDGSYKTRCGDRYDVQADKILDAHGGEMRQSAKLATPEDKKRFIREVCQVSEMIAKDKEAKQATKAKRTNQTNNPNSTKTDAPSHPGAR